MVFSIGPLLSEITRKVQALTLLLGSRFFRGTPTFGTLRHEMTYPGGGVGGVGLKTEEQL